ncbi:MAG: NADH-quinone oxidoreductase subunit J family protein [Anaerolineae bacterium]
MVETVLFAAMAAVAVLAAIGVVGQRNVLYSGLLLALNMVSLAGLYILANAQFVGVAQIIVYAGAVMVLFLFGVMMVSGRRLDVPLGGVSWQLLLAAVVVVALAIELGMLLATGLPPAQTGAGPAGTVENIAALLLTRYAWAFVTMGLLVAVSVVGVVYLLRGGARTSAEG